MRSSVITFLTAFLLLAILAGCREPDDRNHPLFRKAEEARSHGEARHAAEFYLRYLEKRPRSRAAHLALGTLYDESLGEFDSAIYHYRQFLALTSPEEADYRTAEKYLAAAQRRLAALLTKTQEQEAGKLSGENRQLRQQIDALKRYILNQHRKIEALQQQSKPILLRDPDAPRFYTVRRGDTPGKIALQFYGSSAQYRRIVEANSLNNRPLREGQVLKLPPPFKDAK